MKLLPYPRRLTRGPGVFALLARATLSLDKSLKKAEAKAIAERLQAACREVGIELVPRSTRAGHIIAQRRATKAASPEFYSLTIDRRGVRVEFNEIGGLRAAIATLRQLLHEYGRQLPCLKIRDWPDFPRRGVMLDVSRGRVPKLETLLELADHLADFKINELQLYTEHTFAYSKYKSVWRDWGALTGAEIRKLDAHCRQLGIDLVPNQNSFGHLRYFLEHPKVKKLAEVSEPYEDASGEFVRRPSTLAPNHPGTPPFLHGLYDELLPNFAGKFFNIGCDETSDLGRGQSKELCDVRGQGRVYLDFLKQIQREVSTRGKTMMFWGDIILHYPELIKELPKKAIALNWGYEAGHPFDREAAMFARSGIPFYVCSGTSTWMTLIGRHDNAFANQREAAKAGRKHGAIGFLITDWGDGGHPQPPAVSYIPYLHGAAISWCADTCDESLLAHVVSRDIFRDPTGLSGKAAYALGFAHRKLKYFVSNLTPLGAVIAAPPTEQRELFCRDGLKYFTRISGKNIRRALDEIEAQRSVLHRARPTDKAGERLAAELDLGARMAAQSCKFMLWQQIAAAGNVGAADTMAARMTAELRQLDAEFGTAWPHRNKATPKKCSAFLQWRVAELQRPARQFVGSKRASHPTGAKRRDALNTIRELESAHR